MLGDQARIIEAYEAEEKEIWRHYRERWESRRFEMFHAESFLQFNDREIFMPPKEPDTRHSSALVDAFDDGSIALTQSEGGSSNETRSEIEGRIRKVKAWDGIRNVEREYWPPSPLSPPR